MSEEQALARHKYQAAKMQADSWARIIAEAVVKAWTEGDWSHMPTPGMMRQYRDAVAAETQARSAWDRADTTVAS